LNKAAVQAATIRENIIDTPEVGSGRRSGTQWARPGVGCDARHNPKNMYRGRKGGDSKAVSGPNREKHAVGAGIPPRTSTKVTFTASDSLWQFVSSRKPRPWLFKRIARVRG